MMFADPRWLRVWKEALVRRTGGSISGTNILVEAVMRMFMYAFVVVVFVSSNPLYNGFFKT